MAEKKPGCLPLKNSRQEQFCQEYLIDLHAFNAAERAGYTDPNYGRQLLTFSSVSDRIAYLMQERSQRVGVTADRVLNELALIAFSNLDDYAEWGSAGGENFMHLTPSRELTRAQKSVIRSVKHTRKRGKTEEDTLEIVREDKLSALDKIMKHLGMYRPEEGTGRTSGLDALVELMAARKQQRDEERGET